MSRRELGWLAAMAVLALLVAFSAPAFPADAAAASAAETQAAGTAEGAEGETEGETKPPSQGEQTVETILRQQEDLLRGQRFSYNPEGRRDPFESLFAVSRIARDKRPRGVAGMMVAEIDLDGIIEDPSGGNLAFFTGSDNKGYFLRVGDAVYDGTLIAIDAQRGMVTFRQQTDDPRAIKPFRDVPKRLTPEDQIEESGNE